MLTKGKIGVVSNITQNYLSWSLRNLYLVITGPNVHEMLTKCEIKSHCSRFEHWSKSLLPFNDTEDQMSYKCKLKGLNKAYYVFNIHFDYMIHIL